MRVLFRVDASLQIGSGHVARCLTLADAIVDSGGSATFICRDHEGHLVSWIRARGFDVHCLAATNLQVAKFESRLSHGRWLGVPPRIDAQQTIAAIQNESFDWLVVDHYAIDAEWELELVKHIPKIMVVDDLADRDHVANLLLDQNFRLDQSDRYHARVPSSCELMLGPKFALMQPEFASQRESSDSPDKMTRMMIFMGGMDEHNVTTRVLDTLSEMDCALPDEIHAIIGGSNPHREIVQSTCERLQSRRRVSLHIQVSDMASLMSSMSLAIAAGGTNTWERCCLGIPTATIAVAENQISVAEQLDSIRVTRFLGMHNAIDSQSLTEQVRYFLTNTNQHRAMRSASRELVDGLGAQRVVEHMKHLAAQCAA